MTAMLYNQLGLTESILNGTAKEEEMINYYNRTVDPILSFIADEMNVSSPTTMKSLAIALETNINQGIYFPSVEEIIFPSSAFLLFFLSLQAIQDHHHQKKVLRTF